jgi:hypothetical protein
MFFSLVLGWWNIEGTEVGCPPKVVERSSGAHVQQAIASFEKDLLQQDCSKCQIRESYFEDKRTAEIVF